ncbi:MAG: pyridoxamine 5'-phosphate oxidase family protein, partial [Saezia sp.]
EVLQHGQLLSLAMVEADGSPYVVTLSYGYDNGVVYLHGSAEGKKFDTLNHNPKVCFQIVLDAELARNDIPCKCSWKYKSVTGFGHIRTLKTLDEKNHALGIVMRQYDAPYQPLPHIPDSLWVTCIDIEHLSGKISIYPKP